MGNISNRLQIKRNEIKQKISDKKGKIPKIFLLIFLLCVGIFVLLVSNIILLCIILLPKPEGVPTVTQVVTDSAIALGISYPVQSADSSAQYVEPEGETLIFTDSSGSEHEMTINPNAARHNYDVSAYTINNNRLSYSDAGYMSRVGIDVSHHQGKINWKKVAADGIEFAMVRIGFRGYGSGKLCEDRYAARNIEKAKAAGLDVGIYFFSQAVNEEEAREEARMVIELLKGQTLELPVVYDPESIPDDVARTDNVTGEQFTRNSIAFCEEIRAAGYEPMIYSNMMWEAYKLDMGTLKDLPVWYADYQAIPQTPYAYTMWQYSENGRVNGVEGGCDMDVQLIPR